MKFIDENGRLFGKISVIDVVVLLLVAALALSVLFVKQGQPSTGSGTPQDSIAFQVLVSGVDSYMEDAVQKGDKLYDKDYASGGPIGEITDVQVMPGTLQAEYADGTVDMAAVENGINLVITVEGQGLIHDGSYLVNRIYDLGVNAARVFYTKHAQFTGTVTHIF